MSEKPQDLKARTKAFALRVIRMYSSLPQSDTAARVLDKQVLRFGTSVGANYREDSRSRSKAEDITHLQPGQPAASILQREQRVAEIMTNIQTFLQKA